MNNERHEVIVGNIGRVYNGNCPIAAGETFDIYARDSEQHYGRASGEPVMWLEDGEIVKEHEGSHYDDACEERSWGEDTDAQRGED